jgi:hypothetical protein
MLLEFVQLTMIANSAADPAKLLLNTSTRCMTSIKPRTLRPAILIMPDNRDCGGECTVRTTSFVMRLRLDAGARGFFGTPNIVAEVSA